MTYLQACAKSFLNILTDSSDRLCVVPTSAEAKRVAKYDIAIDNTRYNHLVAVYGGNA